MNGLGTLDPVEREGPDPIGRRDEDRVVPDDGQVARGAVAHTGVRRPERAAVERVRQRLELARAKARLAELERAGVAGSIGGVASRLGEAGGRGRFGRARGGLLVGRVAVQERFVLERELARFVLSHGDAVDLQAKVLDLGGGLAPQTLDVDAPSEQDAGHEQLGPHGRRARDLGLVVLEQPDVEPAGALELAPLERSVRGEREDLGRAGRDRVVVVDLEELARRIVGLERGGLGGLGLVVELLAEGAQGVGRQLASDLDRALGDADVAPRRVGRGVRLFDDEDLVRAARVEVAVEHRPHEIGGAIRVAFLGGAQGAVEKAAGLVGDRKVDLVASRVGPVVLGVDTSERKAADERGRQQKARPGARDDDRASRGRSAPACPDPTRLRHSGHLPGHVADREHPRPVVPKAPFPRSQPRSTERAPPRVCDGLTQETPMILSPPTRRERETACSPAAIVKASD